MLLIALAALALLSSCTGMALQSSVSEDRLMPCYSEWNHVPENSL